MTINERVEKLVSLLSNGNKRAFSKTIGVSPTVLENILGKRLGNPSFEVLQKIVYAYANINPDWLLIERGAIFKNENIENSNIIVEPVVEYQTCKQCRTLERIIAEKENRIQELKETISILKNERQGKRNSA